MKTLSTALQNHLQGELTTLAELVKITRTDNSVIAFTNHDRDLVVGGVTYHADGSFAAQEMDEEAKHKANDYDITGLLDSALITAEDLTSGRYDHARVDVYVCNWQDLSQGVIAMRRGWLGEVAQSGGSFKASLRGLHDLLSRKIGDTYTPECRFDLGDSRCGVNVAAYTASGTVTSVTDKYAFSDASRTEEDHLFTGGLLTWTSGSNNGASFEVSSWDLETKSFRLWLPVQHAIAVGDTYAVSQGCNKCFATCKARFSNALNFGGFPYLPGIGKILAYPESS